MSSNLAYAAILAMAVAVMIISFATREINFEVLPSVLNRYEFFMLFLYFSTVATIINSPSEIDKKSEESSDERPWLCTLSIKSVLLLSAPTTLALMSVFITA